MSNKHPKSHPEDEHQADPVPTPAPAPAHEPTPAKGTAPDADDEPAELDASIAVPTETTVLKGTAAAAAAGRLHGDIVSNTHARNAAMGEDAVLGKDVSVTKEVVLPEGGHDVPRKEDDKDAQQAQHAHHAKDKHS
jgi:hypothetical protein